MSRQAPTHSFLKVIYMRIQTLRFAFASLALCSAAFLIGCSGSEAGHTIQAGTPAQQQAGITQQLKAIDDNPHMPPQAKAMAKSQIMAHAGKTTPGR